MTEPATDIVDLTEEPKVRKKRKYTRRKPREAKVLRFEKPDDEFPGLDLHDCCNTCRDGYCEIWGGPQCAHPRKSAPPSELLRDPKALARYRRAQAKLQIMEAQRNAEQ